MNHDVRVRCFRGSQNTLPASQLVMVELYQRMKYHQIRRKHSESLFMLRRARVSLASFSSKIDRRSCCLLPHKIPSRTEGSQRSDPVL